MKILIDTREQCPLHFPASIQTEKATLPVGDYGLSGFSDWGNPAFIVERKSLNDLIGSLTAGRERFMKECEKLRQFRFAAIVIEATQGDIEAGEYQSQTKPQSILQSLAAIQVRCNIHVIYAGTSDRAADIVTRLARQHLRGIQKDAKRLETHG